MSAEPLRERTRTAATAVAHANIALIKYWGKADEGLIIPHTSSLSLTLDDLHTTTSVVFDEALDTDEAALDGRRLAGRALARVRVMLDLVRARAGLDGVSARVRSRNTVPTAAGLASSASGLAALAGAAAAAAGLDLDDRDLSRLARRGSGSAARSVFGGLALWHAGHDDASSYAEPVSSPLGLAIVVIVIDAGPKPVSSREAMRRTVATSPDYPAWVRRSAGDLAEALDAVRTGDLPRLGYVAEANAFGMHGTMLSATPPVCYLTPASLAALRTVWRARRDGLPVWATMDAGPNVKAITSAADAEAVARRLRADLAGVVPETNVIVAHAGPGIQVRRHPAEAR